VFINEYSKTFGVIELYDGMKLPKLLVRIENNQGIHADKLSLKKNWIKNGLPTLAHGIKVFLQS